MPLTHISLRNAVPREKPYKLSDGSGMFLLVNPNGSKWWRLKYRFAGFEKLISLGTYPDVSLKAARERRDDARRSLREGTDPGALRKQEKQKKRAAGDTFAKVAEEYMEKRKGRWAAGYAAHVERRLSLNVFPFLGAQPIDTIKPSGLLTALRKIEKRGAFDQAHRVMQICSQVFRYGVSTGRCERDITFDLRGALTPHAPGKMPAVRPDELPALLMAIDAYQGGEQTRIGLRLVALTFVRTSELIKAQWREIDFEKARWTIPAERMKKRREHLVPLPRQCLELLRELEALNDDSDYLFPSRNLTEHMADNTLLAALYRAGYRGKMSGHGFRSVFRTSMSELRSLGQHSFSREAVNLQMAHKRKDKLEEAYDRAELLPERTSMMQWWADHLDRLSLKNYN
jgi:integrase